MNDLARFNEKVIPVPESGCWLWEGALDRNGYGVFRLDGKATGAHRASYRLLVGDVGQAHVLHSCDNPCCVNPSHLYLGDHKDNMRDMADKARASRGEKCNFAKLTEDQVLQVKSMLDKSGLSHREIGIKFGVSQSLITLISQGKRWGWLND